MKHHIIVKYKPEINAEEKLRLLPEIEELFRHAKEIEGVRDVKVFPNCVPRDNRFDVMIVIDMDKSALEKYDVSEWHKKWKADYADIIEKKAIFDCE